jgi:hypothetical protein
MTSVKLFQQLDALPRRNRSSDCPITVIARSAKRDEAIQKMPEFRLVFLDRHGRS